MIMQIAKIRQQSAVVAALTSEQFSPENLTQYTFRAAPWAAHVRATVGAVVHAAQAAVNTADVSRSFRVYQGQTGQCSPSPNRVIERIDRGRCARLRDHTTAERGCGTR